MSYQEYGEIIKKLIVKIENYLKENNLEFDLIVPILRSGGIPGDILAIHFGITKILPLQFKYFYNPARIEQVLSVPKIFQKVPSSPRILISENNTSGGETARQVIKLLKKLFPKSELYYSTVVRVFGGHKDFRGIEKYFWGTQSNEKFIASPEEGKRLNLRPKITIFPWENPEDELREINSS